MSGLALIEKSLRNEEASKKLSVFLGDKKDSFILSALDLAKNFSTELEKKENQMSFFKGLNTLAELGLEPIGTLNYGYFIPYGGKLDFQLGYRAFVELISRAGINIVVQEVRKNDDFLVDPLNNVHKHEITNFNRGDVIGYYAYSKERGVIELISLEEVESIRQKSSKAPNSPAWKNYFDEMAKKVVIKRFFKRVGALEPKMLETYKIAEALDNQDYSFETKAVQEKRKAMEKVDLEKPPVIDITQEDGGFFDEDY